MSTVTPFADMVPSPRSELLVTSGDVGAAVSVTISSVSDTGLIPVRDAELKPVSGGFFVVDYEPPLGVDLLYRMERFDAGGVSLGFVNLGDARLDIEPGKVIIQDPLAPNRAVMVTGRGDFASSSGVRVRQMERYRAGNRTVALMGETGLLESIPIPVSTYTLDAADALQEVLAENLVLIRTMPNVHRIPTHLYAVIPTVEQLPQNVQWGDEWVIHPLVAEQISRPTLGVVEAAVTYDRFNDFFTTYATFNAAEATYLDHIADPPPEV